MSETRADITTMPATARSRVSNGSSILAGVDGRSATYRRYRDILAVVVSEAFPDGPTEVQMQLARRFAQLSAWSEAQEAAAANGEEIDIAKYTTTTNSLKRVAETIGLKRAMKPVNGDRLARLMGVRDVEA